MEKKEVQRLDHQSMNAGADAVLHLKTLKIPQMLIEGCPRFLGLPLQSTPNQLASNNNDYCLTLLGARSLTGRCG